PLVDSLELPEPECGIRAARLVVARRPERDPAQPPHAKLVTCLSHEDGEERERRAESRWSAACAKARLGHGQHARVGHALPESKKCSGRTGIVSTKRHSGEVLEQLPRRCAVGRVEALSEGHIKR